MVVYLIWYRRSENENWALWGVYGNEEIVDRKMKMIREEYKYECHVNQEHVWE